MRARLSELCPACPVRADLAAAAVPAGPGGMFLLEMEGERTDPFAYAEGLGFNGRWADWDGDRGLWKLWARKRGTK